MKTRRILLAVLAMLLPLMTSAETVEINGICYNIIAKGQFAEVTKKTEKYSGDVIIPSSVTYKGTNYTVSAIKDEAFWECNDLVSVTIPNSVKSIGRSAFIGCRGLTSITIPNSVTSIGDRAFYYCSGLKTCTIGSGVTSIGDYAFYNCSSLTSANCQCSPTSVGYDVFGNCSIKEVTFDCEEVTSLFGGNSINNSIKKITMTVKVTSIGNDAFRNWSGLTSVHISDLSAWCNIRFESNPLSLAHHLFLNGEEIKDLVIPDGVTSIAGRAFIGCTGLTSVAIPNSVTSIGGLAFRGCSGLTSVTIPNSVTSIEDEAFRDCSGLTSVTIPNSVISIGNSAFLDCSAMTSVHISDLSAWCNIRFESNPLSLAHHLFLNGEEIKDLVIPDGVTSIAGRTFDYCTGLTSVTIPNSVTSIGGLAFRGCSGLISVRTPSSVTSIGEAAFEYCSGLTSVTIPNSVTSIGGSAFRYCSGLTSVTIPNSVNSISNYAFKGCTGLTSVTIPNSVTSIGDYAFEYCTGLTSVTIPNSVTYIGTLAFHDCSKLKNVQLGKSVKKISTGAFSNCEDLTDVTCLAKSVPNTEKNAFDNSYIEYTTLHVYESSVEDYKKANPWKTFKTIVAADIPMHTLTYMVDGEVYKTARYEEGEKITAEAEPTKEGYTFSGWSEIPEEMPDHDVTVNGTFTRITLGKCASPTIAFRNGKLVFGCETEDVEYNYEVSANVSQKGKGNDIPVNPSVTVIVYASRDGYDDSDVTTKDIPITASDANGDGIVNAADIVTIVNKIMSAE